MEIAEVIQRELGKMCYREEILSEHSRTLIHIGKAAH